MVFAGIFILRFGRDINLQPDKRLLRQFGLLCCLLLIGVSGWRWWRLGPDILSASQLLLACSVLLMAVSRPSWLRPLFVAWSIAAFPMGWLVSHVLLFVMYFGVFWPTGFVLRLCGWDPLGLRTSGSSSLWQDRPAASDLRRYFRQY